MTTAPSVRTPEPAKLPLFEGMETGLLNGLIASSRVIEHAKGDVFLEQNQPITRYYIILSGWCGISKVNKDGQESILQILTCGDFLPEPDLKVRDVSPFNVQALSPVRLLMIPPTIIHNALQQSIAFSQNMLSAVAQRGQDMRDHIEQLTLRDAEERVGRFLLQIRLELVEDAEAFDLPFDKSVIAAYLGIKPETLSRTLQLFKGQGFKIDRGHIRMPHKEALCGFCDTTTASQCGRAHADDCPNPAYPLRS